MIFTICFEHLKPGLSKVSWDPSFKPGLYVKELSCWLQPRHSLDYGWRRAPQSDHSSQTPAAIEMATRSEARKQAIMVWLSVPSQLCAHMSARCRSLTREEATEWGMVPAITNWSLSPPRLLISTNRLLHWLFSLSSWKWNPMAGS